MRFIAASIRGEREEAASVRHRTSTRPSTPSGSLDAQPFGEWGSLIVTPPPGTPKGSFALDDFHLSRSAST
jgi:hypothetical protein